MKRLPRNFYTRDTHTVAREVLGKLLVRSFRGKEFAVRIHEVECYVGEHDRACHASRGRTPRTEVMFGEAGHAYVYLIYGMYHCLNIVTEREGFPAAVLIRGVVEHSSLDKGRLGGVHHATQTPSIPLIRGKLDGPGKLCHALNITRVQNGEDLATSEKLFIADDGFRVTADSILTTPRINVAYAGADAWLPWRYVLRNQA